MFRGKGENTGSHQEQLASLLGLFVTFARLRLFAPRTVIRLLVLSVQDGAGTSHTPSPATVFSHTDAESRLCDGTGSEIPVLAFSNVPSLMWTLVANSVPARFYSAHNRASSVKGHVFFFIFLESIFLVPVRK